MAIPTSTYDEATLVNPTSALTDFTLMIDLSRMTAAWWAGCDTSTVGYGRAAKEDGTTELAVDWLDFVKGTPGSGWARVKYSGTLAASGTQGVQLFPPNTANTTAYGVTDTYGGNNAYDSIYVGYWPLMEDLNDRCSDANHGTGNGTAAIVPGDATGKAGAATSFDGTDQWINVPHDVSLDMPNNIIEVSCWGKVPYEPNDWASMIARRTGGGDYDYNMGHRAGSHSTVMGHRAPDNSSTQAIGTSDYSDVWEQYLGTMDGDTNNEGEIFVNNISETTTAEGGTGITFDTGDTSDVWFARSGVSTNQYIDADLQHLKIENALRHADWRTQEYDQMDDQATMWGTWSNVSGGSTRRIMSVA